ncbi:von Willebrand factor type A domain-containing protein [Myxococcus sp. RHSTA-1-4]|uniref:YfbK domain-containing protein n=1 Tax=Myxococcus sp. RHSTA-1-4 TaxID=2874601 RepID=UPI001CC104B1|nr:von Willebrand factor type A domain-containing protein [Myxococcus sp. RHSTA-1-4]MBZ4419132.1 von Willebrand factor type A domain-containing protein [Myxococcus sp. RHSTA-1-4]
MKRSARSLLCGLLMMAAPALAQPDAGPESGIIIGTVIDAQSRQPVPGVVVSAASPNLQGEQTVVTDAQGNYRIPQLPPGVYTLRFEKEAYRPYARGDIRLRPKRTIRLNVELLPESLGKVVEITGAPPTLDVGSTSTGVAVDQEFIKRIAVASPGGRGGAARAYESLAESKPAAQVDTYGVSINGATSPENGYVVDGLSARDPAFGINGAPEAGAAAVHMPSAPARASGRTAPPKGGSFFDMYFQGYGVNPTVTTEEERVSTFSVDTDTASYTVTRAFLERGVLPDEQAVRVEEFVNSFDYGYAAEPDAPFSVHVEGFPSPVRKGYQVVHLGVKAREVSRAQRKPSHLVFVIDVSGSMDLENRLGLVKRALRLLVEELDERDRVSIVVYGSEARQVLGPTSATRKQVLLEAIDGLRSEGSTNAQAGLELGYTLAAKHLQKGGINRVILCSDGVANNGITDADGIWARVKDFAARGITLSTVGFGMGNYNDVLMERLSHVGEGHYAYVDRLEEARRIFVQNLTGTLQVVAKDVKLQVEFDPKAVARYRLIGYENRLLTKEQFSDDKVDAGEVGAGHAVTALYEVKLREPAATFGTLRIRYKAPEGGDSKLMEKPLPSSLLRPAYGRAAPPTRLSYVAAAFAEKLRGSYWVRPLSYEGLLSLWEEIGQPLKGRADVVELGDLIRKAHALDRREDRFEPFAPVSAMDFDRVPTLP